MTKQLTCKLELIAKDKLVENPLQPVGRTDDNQMKGIKKSLAEHGLVSPLAVAPAPGRLGYYMVADGTRRWTGFEGDSINCLVYEDADPLELFIVMNGTRKTIGGAAWMSSYSGAEVEARAHLLAMMPSSARKWIAELESMIGTDEVLALGKRGKQSPGIVNAVKTAVRLLMQIGSVPDCGTICRWMLKHNMQDTVNRLNKDKASAIERRRLREAIKADVPYDKTPERRRARGEANEATETHSIN